MSAIGHAHVETHGVREIRRTQIVWATFICAMTVVCGLLLLVDGSMPTLRGGPVLGPGEVLGGQPQRTGIFDTAAPLDDDRWQAIIIHHSNTPAGDAAQLHRQHLAFGLEGLGYHFVIGNGNGMNDGAVHVGYRWVDQTPGAHAIGDEQDWYNQHAIGICLIGNGNSRPFSDHQFETLIRLVSQLQMRFGIDAGQVRLHREIAEGIESPGRYFSESRFRERLLALPIRDERRTGSSAGLD